MSAVIWYCVWQVDLVYFRADLRSVAVAMSEFQIQGAKLAARLNNYGNERQKWNVAFSVCVSLVSSVERCLTFTKYIPA